VALLRSVGIKTVVVHGGGPQIGELSAKLGKQAVFKGGLRVTDAETLDIVRMVLVGKVNRDIVSAINRHGPIAVGMSGEDGNLIEVAQRNPDLGFVGDVTKINTIVLDRLIAESIIPVIATIGVDAHGQAYNINADLAAGALAAALRAEKFIAMTDVPGLLEDPKDESTLVRRISYEDLKAQYDANVFDGGMAPKVESCLAAVEGGVPRAHMLDGRQPRVLLLELLTRAGVGTMVYSPAQPPIPAGAPIS
jgi:acetylglutamate kinase